MLRVLLVVGVFFTLSVTSLFTQQAVKVRSSAVKNEIIDFGHTYPYPFPNGSSPCYSDTPPVPSSFHMHVIFNGSNRASTSAAVALRKRFLSHINPYTHTVDECPFSHPNCAPDFPNICAFPFEDDGVHYGGGALFGLSNWAFFIPKTEYLYTSLWIRQNNDPQYTSVFFHVCTGCETLDHSKWTMVNYGFYDPFINLRGLLCCNDGPNLCYCDITQYQIKSSDDSNGKCLVGDYDNNAIILDECSDGGYDRTSWRETFYTDDFIQIENFGDASDGGNVYQCLGINPDTTAAVTDECSDGTELKLIECYQNDLTLNLFQYDFDTNQIQSGRCDGMCVGISDDSLQLTKCESGAVFNRIWLRDLR